MSFRRLKRRLFFLLVLIVILYIASKFYPEPFQDMTGAIPKAQNKVSDALTNAGIKAEVGDEPVVIFCPRDHCGLNLEYMMNKSSKIHCAFFDLDLENVITVLKRKNALVVVDADNYQKEFNGSMNFMKDNRKAFMHNKFCIFDDKIVWTGSFNPTHNCDEKNNNNAVIINSKRLAQNYEEEFQELWKGSFGKGYRITFPEVKLNNITFKNYFCPEDSCANNIMKELDKANKSIYFMTFSFTHDKIGDMLVKKHGQGVDVKGVFEKSQNSQYAEFSKLAQNNISVKLDTNPGMMHHKVFIIDNRTVVTGSFNPTMNGDMDNDENVLIIKDEKIAKKFLDEFKFVFG